MATVMVKDTITITKNMVSALPFFLHVQNLQRRSFYSSSSSSSSPSSSSKLAVMLFLKLFCFFVFCFLVLVLIRLPAHTKGCSCAMSATPDDIELHKLVGTALDFELELVQVEREGSYKRGDWELSWEEKAAAVPALKESGNAHFKRGDALAAEADYMKALGFLEALKLAESEM